MESHFITVLQVSPPDSTGIPIHYIDPWGGRKSTGTFKSSSEPQLGLEADLPITSVGRRLIRAGEKTHVTVSAAIGRL
ncbi:MAG: hypothetical protein QM755_11725 [Luteolibacter sp.]